MMRTRRKRLSGTRLRICATAAVRLRSAGMEWYHWILIVLLIALIAYWVKMRRKGT